MKEKDAEGVAILILKFYFSIYLEGLRKAMKTCIRIVGFWDEMQAQETSEYKADLLSTTLQCLEKGIFCMNLY
jgi:hypothetical protein